MDTQTNNTMTREQTFAAKAENYCVCYTTHCPLREHCLRHILASYTPADRTYVQSVNLNHPRMQKDDCPQYRSDEPIRMPVGLSTIYYDMPGRMERAIKHHLINVYSRKRYYEYHNGTRPMTPDVEQYVRQVISNAGWTGEPRFLNYVEDFLW